MDTLYQTPKEVLPPEPIQKLTKQLVNKDNLSKFIVIIHQLPAYYGHTHMTVELICNVWRISSPWYTHLWRVKERYPIEFFRDAANVEAFINGYLEIIRKVDQLVIDESGVRMSLNVDGKPPYYD